MAQTENLKQLQSERTRRILVEAAKGLLLRNGYAATTLAMLADEVGMTKGAIYHHFDGKEAILRAVLEDVRASWQREVGARIPVRGSALEQLGALFERQAELINANPSLCLLVNGLMLESDTMNEELTAEIRRIDADLTEFVHAMVARGQKAGAVRTDLKADALARAIVAVVKGISCSREMDPSDRAFTSKMDTARRVVLDGIRR